MVHTVTWLASALLAISYVWAEPLQASFSRCSSKATTSSSLVVSSVFADLLSRERADELGLIAGGDKVLRLDVYGDVGQDLVGFNNETEKLATLFSTTKTLTFTSHSSTTYLCNSLFPASLPNPYGPNVTYCPFPAGPFGMNLSIPLSHKHALTTLTTQIRVVDASVPPNELLCINVSTTPFYQASGIYLVFLWVPVAIAIGYWVTCWAARFAAGWVVGRVVAEGPGGTSAPGATGHLSKLEHGLMRKWGTMMVSGLSGERLSVSGGLLRFVTPGFRDVIFHVQFCCMLGMLAVNWPALVYPILSQASWASLVWNVTLVQGTDAGDHRLNTLPNDYNPPSQFAEQTSSSSYPLYLPPHEYNPLLNLDGADHGMSSWATAVGLRRQDLFGTCLAIFLMLVGGVLLLSLTVWATHGFAEYLMGGGATASHGAAVNRNSLGTSPRSSQGGKDNLDLRDKDGEPSQEGEHTLPVQAPVQRPSSAPSRMQRTWWRFRLKGAAGAFHSAALYGNLVRLIVLFHLPITIFSVYQLTLGPSATLASKILAAFAFAFISVLLPVGLLLKVVFTPSAKLYDATRTLLSLAPLYNVYEQGNQLFPALTFSASLIQGIVVGGAQKSGTAQAIILLIVEIAMALATAITQPWGEGAGMGVPSFIMSTLRIITMVLILILSPAIDITTPAAGWITYGVLILQGIVFLFFTCMLISKIIEGLIRLFGNVHFDESTHPLDGGLFAACSALDCLGGAGGGAAAARRRRKRGSRQYEQNITRVGSLSTQMMLDRHSQNPRLSSGEHMLGDYPLTSSAYATPGSVQSTGYFTAVQIGPDYPVTSDESADGHIMGAWRTPGGYRPGGNQAFQQAAATYPTHLRTPSAEREELLAPGAMSPQRGFSVVGGGKADANDPYAAMAPAARPPSAYRVAEPQQRPMPPRHSRTRSQTAVIEDIGAADFWANDHMSGSHRPPALAMLRSQAESSRHVRSASPSSDYSDESRRPKNKKRNSKSSSAWAARTPPDDSDASDRESRSRKSGGKRHRDTTDVEKGEPSEGGRGWFSSALRTIGGVKDRPLAPAEEQAKDANKVRKAALLAESGALLAGVDDQSRAVPPVSSFQVVRQSRPSLTLGTSSSSAPPLQLPQKDSVRNDPDATTATGRSFKVIRPERNSISPLSSPTASGFIVNRPSRTPGPTSYVPLAEPASSPSALRLP